MLPDLSELLTYFPLFHRHPLLRECIKFQVGVESWVCLGGTAGRPHELAAAKHFRPENFNEVDLDRSTSLFRQPDWYNPERPWRGYVPDVAMILAESHATTAEWMFSFLDGCHEQFTNPTGNTALSPAVRAMIAHDFYEGKIMLGKLSAAVDFSADYVLQEYQVTDLYSRYGVEDVRNGLNLARTRMLELIGAIAYAYALADVREQTDIIATHSQTWSRWKLHHAPKLGFLLDLQSTYTPVVPLLDYLRDDVPVYLPYDPAYLPKSPSIRTVGKGPLINETTFAELLNSSVHRKLTRPAITSQQREIVPVADGTRGAGLCCCKTPYPIDVSTRTIYDGAPDIPTFATSEPRNFQVPDLCPWEKAFLLLRPIWLFDQTHSLRTPWFEWSRAYMKKGRLTLPSISELKLRTWAHVYGVCHAVDILTEALRRGMPFQISLPAEDIYEFRRHIVTCTDSLTPFYIVPGYIEPALPPLVDVEQSWELYQARAREILNRPHAVAFLFQGGILWRIALSFGPPDLLQMLAAGPSRSLVEHNHTTHTDDGFMSDCVTSDEVEALLGRCPTANGSSWRTWWPFPDYFVHANWDDGEWTPAHEEWFKARLRAYHQGRCAAMSQHRWNAELTHRRIHARNTAGDGPNDGQITRALRDIEQTSGKRWNGELLHTLSL